MRSHSLQKLGITFLSASLTILPLTSVVAEAATLPSASPMTGAEPAAVLMHSFALSPSSVGPVFHDVLPATPASTAIETVTGDLLLGGVGPFCLCADPATRLELAAALENELGLRDSVAYLQVKPNVRDASAIPRQDWGIVDAALRLHLLASDSDGHFDPNGPVTAALYQTAVNAEKRVSPMRWPMRRGWVFRTGRMRVRIRKSARLFKRLTLRSNAASWSSPVASH